jgi:uncharacterized protein (DUF2062 family)
MQAPSSVQTRLTRGARRLWNRALKEHATPREIGVSVGAGVFAAATPLHGAHWAVAIGLATLLRVNRLWALLASRISVFPVYVAIIFCEIESAHRIRTGTWASLARGLTLAQASRLLGDWLLGMVVFGGALAAFAGFVAYSVARRTQRDLTTLQPAPALPEPSGSLPSAPPGPTP